jgi:hypothetical protein
VQSYVSSVLAKTKTRSLPIASGNTIETQDAAVVIMVFLLLWEMQERDSGMKMLYNGLPELGVGYHILILHPLSGANEVSG